MTATVVSKQYVQGVGVASVQAVGQPLSQPYQWQYDLTVVCPFCHMTVRMNATHSQPSAELLVLQDQPGGPGSCPSVSFHLQDPATGWNLFQYQHSCTGGNMNTVAGGSGLTASNYSNLEVDLHGWLQKIEQKLNTRFAGEQEVARLAGMVQMLTDKLKWTTEELHATKGRNVAFAQQIRQIHEALDCPCEMELDSYDLLGHMDEMGISFTD